MKIIDYKNQKNTKNKKQSTRTKNKRLNNRKHWRKMLKQTDTKRIVNNILSEWSTSIKWRRINRKMRRREEQLKKNGTIETAKIKQRKKYPYLYSNEHFRKN